MKTSFILEALESLNLKKNLHYIEKFHGSLEINNNYLLILSWGFDRMDVLDCNDVLAFLFDRKHLEYKRTDKKGSMFTIVSECKSVS